VPRCPAVSSAQWALRWEPASASAAAHLGYLGQGGLALVLVGLLGVLGFAHTARAADDYSVSLQTPDLIRQFEYVWCPSGL